MSQDELKQTSKTWGTDFTYEVGFPPDLQLGDGYLVCGRILQEGTGVPMTIKPTIDKVYVEIMRRKPPSEVVGFEYVVDESERECNVWSIMIGEGDKHSLAPGTYLLVYGECVKKAYQRLVIEYTWVDNGEAKTARNELNYDVHWALHGPAYALPGIGFTERCFFEELRKMGEATDGDESWKKLLDEILAGTHECPVRADGRPVEARGRIVSSMEGGSELAVISLPSSDLPGDILDPTATEVSRPESFITFSIARRSWKSVPGAPTTSATTGKYSTFWVILDAYETFPIGTTMSGAPRIGRKKSSSSVDYSLGDVETTSR
ncbi:hypothetical protein HD806DRAFT_532829 [Xylariaceae sp. AK1471]|nr:hypothetical protein HD806DRAFT_532829 [Xylariaceae sp. AK1471]